MKRKGIKSLLAMLLIAVLMASFSVPAFACHDYTRPQTAKYTVYYREYGSNTQLAPSVTKSATVGKTVTESAIEISGYTVYGQSTQSLYIRRGYCNTITFYYQKQQVQTTDYYVRYLEYGTEEVLAPEKHVENQSVGSVVTETAIDIEGYRLVGSDTQTLELKACGTSGGSQSGGSTASVAGPVSKAEALQIALAHAGLSSSSIKDIEVETDYEHGVKIFEVEFECRHGYEYEYDIECSTGKILDYEWEHRGCSKCKSSSSTTPVLTCPIVPNCDPVTPTPCPGEDTEACNEIIFYYEKMPALTDYVVKYLDKDTNEPVAADKVQTGLEVGTSVTENAIPVDGYTAVDPTEATLVLVEDGNEIIFYYEKQPALTDYVVKYLDKDTNEPVAADKVQTGLEVGTSVTESAIPVDGYGTFGPTESTLVLADGGNEIIFYYQKLTSYTIHYIDGENGDVLHESKTVTGVPVGTVITEYAEIIPQFSPEESEMTFTLLESGNEFVFYYSSLTVDP